MPRPQERAEPYYTLDADNILRVAHGTTIPLTPVEAALLSVFAARPGDMLGDRVLHRGLEAKGHRVHPGPAIVRIIVSLARKLKRVGMDGWLELPDGNSIYPQRLYRWQPQKILHVTVLPPRTARNRRGFTLRRHGQPLNTRYGR